PLDLLEFFFLTPLPGSEDHKKLWQKGVWMDPDLNKYDLNHRVAHHPKMSDAEWEDTYRAAWRAYYTPDHIRTVMRRAAAHARGRPRRIVLLMLWFLTAIHFESVHPLESGAVRKKFRRDRRHSLPLENPFVFYTRLAGETIYKLWGYAALYLRARKILNEVMKAPDRESYVDLAIAPQQNELEVLDLYHATRGGAAAIARKLREDQIRVATGVPRDAAAAATPV